MPNPYLNNMQSVPVPIPPSGRIELVELPFPEPDKREELPVTDPVDEGPLSKVP
jgi:hypothetical protein